MAQRRLLLVSLLIVLTLSLSLSLPTVEVEAQGPLMAVVVGRLWDGQSAGGTLLVNHLESTGCTSLTGYGSVNMGGNSDKAESGQGFNGCNKLKVYDLINQGPPSLTCAPYCSTFGTTLNNKVSSYALTYN